MSSTLLSAAGEELSEPPSAFVGDMIRIAQLDVDFRAAAYSAAALKTNTKNRH